MLCSPGLWRAGLSSSLALGPMGPEATLFFSRLLLHTLSWNI